MWPGRTRKLLALVLVTSALLIQCRQRQPPLPPIERGVLVADLIELSSGRRRQATASGTVLVPEGSVVRLWGRMSHRNRRQEELPGPVEFVLSVNDDVVFSKTIARQEGPVTFAEAVPLDAFAGQEVNYELRLEGMDRSTTVAAWTVANLERVVSTPRRAARSGPNLLFVVVDTLRADHCSLYGYERPTTPFLETLAGSSLVFERAISQAPWTMPATATLLTGLYPPEHGVVDTRSLPQSMETMAELLQSLGVSTFAASANPLIEPRFGFAQGFETFEHLPWEQAAQINDSFLRWLGENRGVRWFAYLHYIDPHDPYSAPEPYGDRFVDPSYDGPFDKAKTLDSVFLTLNWDLEPPSPVTSRDVDYLKGAYDGEILYWDTRFAELVATLDAQELLDETILIITADHGEEFLEHGKLKHGHQLFDESIRVPLLIRAPGLLAPGRAPLAVETKGIFTTALWLMNGGRGEPPSDSLTAKRSRRMPLYSHLSVAVSPDDRSERRIRASVERGEWSLLRDFDPEGERLYDRSQDPAQQRNLAALEPDKSSVLSSVLLAWLAEVGRGDRPPQEADPDLLEQLRALGYLQ